MRYCSFTAGGEKRFGFELFEGAIVDIQEAIVPLFEAGKLSSPSSRLSGSTDLKNWLSAGSEALKTADDVRQLLLEHPEPETQPGVYALTQTRLLAPIQKPDKIIGVGLNYRQHAEEQNKPIPERPILFAKFPNTVIGPEEPIRIPPVSNEVDPEAELCVVVLEKCRRVSRLEAQARVAFTVANDVSARDLQYADKQWVRGKSCDTFAPCGPFVVTADEIGNPHDLKIELYCNDELQQSSNTSDLIFDSFELVEYISSSITLKPGDLIFTGTPAGVGVFRDPPVFLEAGDVVEVRIEKLGSLRNPVVSDQ